MDKEPLEAKEVQHLTLDQLFELSLQELRKREGITDRELRILRRYLRCILNGGVYLRTVSEKRDLKDMCLCFPTWVLYLNGAWCATWRTGVLACKKQGHTYSAKVVPFVPKVVPRCPGKEYSSWVCLQ